MAQLTGEAARQAWETAAARSRNPRRGDPQALVIGGPAALAAVRELMTPCECGHPQVEHDIADHDVKTRGIARGQRTWCSRMDTAGRCSCEIFTPAL